VGLLGRQLTTPIGNEWLCDFGVFSLLFSGSGTGSINASLVLANLADEAASATTRASTIQQEGNIMNPEERVQMLLAAKPNSWVALSHDESKVVGTGSTYSEAVDAARQKGEEDPLLKLYGKQPPKPRPERDED